MRMIPATTTEELFHAYLIEGEAAVVLPELVSWIEKTLKVPTRGNPDFHVRECDALSIDEGRELKQLASRQAVGTTPKLFVLSFGGATREAQNSLLKLFEEPAARTHFFVVVPSAEILLPTLRSRMQFTRASRKSETVAREVQAFMSGTPAERLALVKEITDAKDKVRALALIQGIELALYRTRSPEQMSESERGLLTELMKVQSYLQDRSPSMKQLLEHVALRLS